jgi:hypothetical protein
MLISMGFSGASSLTDGEHPGRNKALHKMPAVDATRHFMVISNPSVDGIIDKAFNCFSVEHF